jgi:hypothetical protein
MSPFSSSSLTLRVSIRCGRLGSRPEQGTRQRSLAGNAAQAGRCTVFECTLSPFFYATQSLRSKVPGRRGPSQHSPSDKLTAPNETPVTELNWYGPIGKHLSAGDVQHRTAADHHRTPTFLGPGYRVRGATPAMAINSAHVDHFMEVRVLQARNRRAVRHAKVLNGFSVTASRGDPPIRRLSVPWGRILRRPA